MATSALRML